MRNSPSTTHPKKTRSKFKKVQVEPREKEKKRTIQRMTLRTRFHKNLTKKWSPTKSKGRNWIRT